MSAPASSRQPGAIDQCKAARGPPGARQLAPHPPRTPPIDNWRAGLPAARPLHSHSPSPHMLQMETQPADLDAQQAPLPSDSESDMDAGETWMTQSRKRRRRATPILAQNTELADPKGGKIPPIIVTGVTKWTPLFTKLREMGANFSAKFVGQSLHLHANNIDSFRAIQRDLADQSVDFHTYSLKEELELKTVLRGLPSFTSPEEIKEALEDAGYTPTHVAPLERRDAAARHPTNSFYVRFRKSGSWAEIWDQRELLGIRVTFSLFSPKNTIPQCYRCQQFGHGSGSCHRPARCVKCGGPHTKDMCMLSTGDPPKCANCDGPHPASWRGCRAHKDAQRAQTRREPARGQQGNRVPAPHRQRPASAPRRPPPPSPQTQDPVQTDGERRPNQPPPTAPETYAEATRRRRRNRPNRNPANRHSDKAVTAPDKADATPNHPPANQVTRCELTDVPPRPSPRKHLSTRANPPTPACPNSGPTAPATPTPKPPPTDTSPPSNLPDSVSGVTLFRWMMTALPLILQGGLSPEDLLKALMASMTELLSYG